MMMLGADMMLGAGVQPRLAEDVTCGAVGSVVKKLPRSTTAPLAKVEVYLAGLSAEHVAALISVRLPMSTPLADVTMQAAKFLGTSPELLACWLLSSAAETRCELPVSSAHAGAPCDAAAIPKAASLMPPICGRLLTELDKRSVRLGDIIAGRWPMAAADETKSGTADGDGKAASALAAAESPAAPAEACSAAVVREPTSSATSGASGDGCSSAAAGTRTSGARASTDARAGADNGPDELRTIAFAVQFDCAAAGAGVDVPPAVLVERAQTRLIDGMTMLHHAVRARAPLPVLRRLAEANPAAAAQPASPHQYTPLLDALCMEPRDDSAAALLLDACPAAARRVYAGPQSRHSGWLPLHFAADEAGWSKSSAAVTLLLAAFPAAAYNARNVMRHTPLHLACLSGAPAEAVLALLAAAPAAAARRDRDGFSPLDFACDRADTAPEVLRALLEAYPEAANDSYATCVDDLEHPHLPPLLRSIRAGQSVECVRALLPAAWLRLQRAEQALLLSCTRADVITALLAQFPALSRVRSLKPALHAALMQGAPVSAVAALLRAVLLTDWSSEPLRVAAASPVCPVDVTQLLMELCPWAVHDAADARRDSALYNACATPGVSSETVRALLSAAPQCAGFRSARLDLPLHAAASRTDIDAATLRALLAAHPAAAICKAGASASVPLLVSAEACVSTECFDVLMAATPGAAELRNGSGMTALHLLAEKRGDAASLPARLHAIRVLLASNPAAATVSDNNARWSPLHSACANDAYHDVVNVLVAAAPAQAALPDARGRLPLHLACAHGLDASTVRMLLDAHPAGAATRDDAGLLPLHHAAAYSETAPEVLRLLLAAFPEAATDSNNRAVNTPLLLSAMSGQARECSLFLLAAAPAAASVRASGPAFPLQMPLPCAPKSRPLRLCDRVVRAPPSHSEGRSSAYHHHDGWEYSWTAQDTGIVVGLQSTGTAAAAPALRAAEDDSHSAVAASAMHMRLGAIEGEGEEERYIQIKREVAYFSHGESVLRVRERTLRVYTGPLPLPGMRSIVHPHAPADVPGLAMLDASVGAPVTSSDLSPGDGLLPLHYACSHPSADPVLIAALLAASPAAASCRNNAWRATPLHFACQYAAPAAVLQCLIDAAPDTAATVDWERRVPFQLLPAARGLETSSSEDASVRGIIATTLGASGSFNPRGARAASRSQFQCAACRR